LPAPPSNVNANWQAAGSANARPIVGFVAISVTVRRTTATASTICCAACRTLWAASRRAAASASRSASNHPDQTLAPAATTNNATSPARYRRTGQPRPCVRSGVPVPAHDRHLASVSTGTIPALRQRCLPRDGSHSKHLAQPNASTAEVGCDLDRTAYTNPACPFHGFDPDA
jgi:hypothetical protein